MRSWQADVLRATDHVFGSFHLPPVPLILRGKSCKTNKKRQNSAKMLLKLEKKKNYVGNGLVTPEVASASLFSASRAMCGNENILFPFSTLLSGTLIGCASKAAKSEIFSDYIPFTRGFLFFPRAAKTDRQFWTFLWIF